MANPKDILVVTTSVVDGVRIKKYLKPVSAHIVAGTNLFSDFFASISDVFGGRSQTYQKQLTSLYNDAVEQIKYAAYELGANCVVGLKIDMDEISGKGKSMFMLTAVGTAVILEKEEAEIPILSQDNKKLENVSIDKVSMLSNKKAIINKAQSASLTLNEETWNFITINKIDEVFPFVLMKFSEIIKVEDAYPETSSKFYKYFLSYVESLSEEKKINFLYNGIKNEKSERVVSKLSEIIKELNLFDSFWIMELFKDDNFEVRKRGIRLLTYDKPFYNKQDVKDLQMLNTYLSETFVERGTRTTKKQLLSSKEKDVWICECGKINDADTYCDGCDRDITGFKQEELKPSKVSSYIEEKINLITEFLD